MIVRLFSLALAGFMALGWLTAPASATPAASTLAQVQGAAALDTVKKAYHYRRHYRHYRRPYYRHRRYGYHPYYRHRRHYRHYRHYRRPYYRRHHYRRYHY
jgi:hypothetical protein